MNTRTSYRIQSHDAMRAIRFCELALSKDTSLLPITYMRVEFDATGKIVLVATDGRRLHTAVLEDFGIECGGVFSVVRDKLGRTFLINCNDDLEADKPYPQWSRVCPDITKWDVYACEMLKKVDVSYILSLLATESNLTIQPKFLNQISGCHFRDLTIHIPPKEEGGCGNFVVKAHDKEVQFYALIMGMSRGGEKDAYKKIETAESGVKA